MSSFQPMKPSALAVSLGLLLAQIPALAQQTPATPSSPQQSPATPSAQVQAPAPAEAQHSQTPSATVDAQSAPTQQSDAATDLDAVVVTGYRSSIERSLEQKRSTNSIVEVITAEDVSKFPDKNVADALQRVPGVIITRSGGEGKSVSVRGLAPGLTVTQLNGNYVASSETNDEASRSFNYVLMPANMLSGAELYKSPEARFDEGGIGGTVILRTRRPLDVPANTGFGSIEGTYSDTTRSVDPQLSGMYSWHSEDDRFGFLVGATQQERNNRSMSVATEGWQWYGDDYAANPATDVNGKPFTQGGIGYWWGESGFYDQSGNYYTNFFMPTAVSYTVHDEQRKRAGTQLTLQFKPTDNSTLTANYFRFDLQGNYTRNMLKTPEWNISRFAQDGSWPGGRLLNGLTFDPSGTIVTGVEYEKLPGKTYYCNDQEAEAGGMRRGGNWGPDDCTIATPQLSGAYSREEALSQTADVEFEVNADTFNVAAKLGRTWSEGGPSVNFRMSAKPRRNLGGRWQSGNQYSAWDLTGTPSMTFSPNLHDNLMAGIAEVDTGSTDSSWRETSIAQSYFQLDATRFFESGWLESLQFGTKFSNADVRRNTGNTYWVCQGADTTDYDSRYQTGCDPEAGIAQPGFFLSKPLGDLAGGFDANVFPGIDFPAYLDHLNQRYGGTQNRREPDFIYNVGEDVSSAYLQANFNTERLRGNVGVRMIRTQQRANATDSVEYFLDYFANGPDGKPLPCNCDTQFVRNDVRVKTFERNMLEKSYDDVLPSFNIAWDLAENWVLRGAASKAISRLAYTDIAYPGGYSFYSAEYSNDRLAAGGTIEPGWYGSGSNKTLDPYKATQYDIALEWYFHPGSVAGIGLFRKNVKNFIVPVIRDQQVTIGDQTVLVNDYSTKANGRNGVSQGVELYGQHTFDSGFGIQANYTYNDTNLAAIDIGGEQIGASPLIGSAKNQANLTVFYENDRFLARASYNRRGVVVNGLVSGLSVYDEPYDQLDLNAAYNVSDRLTLTGSVLNVTKSEQRSHLGNDTKARLWSNNYAGRIMYLGLTYKF